MRRRRKREERETRPPTTRRLRMLHGALAARGGRLLASQDRVVGSQSDPTDQPEEQREEWQVERLDAVASSS